MLSHGPVERDGFASRDRKTRVPIYPILASLLFIISILLGEVCMFLKVLHVHRIQRRIRTLWVSNIRLQETKPSSITHLIVALEAL